jgi:hypothetical protein
MGLEQSDKDIWERIGTRMLAVAVLEATSVTIVVLRAIIKLTTRMGRF